MVARQNIFQYTDYRTLLKDHFSRLKSKNPSWSYGAWARQLGLKSPSTVIMIVNGDRNPGPKLIKKITKQLQFTQDEAEFFEDLVRLKKAEGNSRLMVEILENLKKQQPRIAAHLINDEAFATISNWHYYAIRELVNLRSFNENPAWICKRLKYKVTPGQAKDAIASLLKLGLLKRDEQERLVQAVSRVDTASDFASEGLKRFHEQALTHAKESIRSADVHSREIYGSTLAIKMENLQKAKKLIRDFHAELCELLGEEGADEVYHLEIAFYPLTRIQGEIHATH